ncbi:xylose isomerase [Reinekea blandensis]|uniref:Xylose isomerase n=1 Tax=Reinekea blandensis MED297 TaxID=314283 RepID=A4BCC3_9GAMM|nr:xylose isomerase [Reinekea blandensis]EAR10189.1 xylose isomerase [Reinekea sp. MED297] [Reinekea blandensis MED297]
MSADYFKDFDAIPYEGPESTNPLAFRHYNKDKVVMGKRLEDHLRFAVCHWHNFCWDGKDIFGLGIGTFDRPWQRAGEDGLVLAREKMDAAFAFMEKLGVPFWCWHDYDIAPEGATIKESRENFAAMLDYAEEKMAATGIRLLWGTANAFSNPRYMCGASTNPNPEVFAYAASQVQNAMDATKRLGGSNYVLWGGREGYQNLLNTDLKRESEQMGRFLQMVVEHKHKIGFEGSILIEPKPQEPTKHQYDYDTATVYGFLQRFGLEKEIKVNIEVNHATLAGHSFEHEVATAASLGILGSVDANRGDHQNGWDTDQFPNNVPDLVPAVYEIIRAGGFTTGGFNFDTKLRRESVDAVDLFHGHIGGMDTIALAFMKAADLYESGELQSFVDNRYAGWNGELGEKIKSGQLSLAELSQWAVDQNIDPKPISGRQEYLENLVNRYVHR